MELVITIMSNIVIGILQSLVGFLAYLYMIPFVFLIKWDKEPTYAFRTGPTPFDPSLCIRGDLPDWLKWAQTGDSRISGYYEPQILAAYGNGSYWRRLWAAYLWLGVRNRAQGLAFKFGKPAVGYIPNPYDSREDLSLWDLNKMYFYREEDKVWKQIRTFLGIRFEYGNQVYKTEDGFVAVNLFTLRKA